MFFIFAYILIQKAILHSNLTLEIINKEVENKKMELDI